MSSAADETKQLLRLARRKADEGRRQLLAICGELLGGAGSTLTSLEYALMRDILVRLVEEVAAPLRRDLAEALTSRVPSLSDAAAMLSSDRIDLVTPLLLGAESVLELELVETLRNRAFEHRLTLAMRRSQSDLSDGNLLPGEDAIDGLLRLPDPAPELVMAYLLDQSRRFDQLLEPVVRPADLSPGLRKQLVVWLLAGMRHHLQQSHGGNSAELDDAIEAATATATAAPAAGPEPAVLVARHLDGMGAVTGQLMLQVLRQGEVALFAALLAEAAGLRVELVRRMLFEPGADGLAIICRATGLGRSVLASMFLLTRRARPAQHAAAPSELSQLVALHDAIDPAAARGVLARWRRNRDFLTALRFIEEAAGRAEDDDRDAPAYAWIRGKLKDADRASITGNG